MRARIALTLALFAYLSVAAASPVCELACVLNDTPRADAVSGPVASGGHAAHVPGPSDIRSAPHPTAIHLHGGPCQLVALPCVAVAAPTIPPADQLALARAAADCRFDSCVWPPPDPRPRAA